MVKVRINDLLESRGRTAYWLAVETGIHHAVIAKLRHGKAKSMRFDVLERLCSVLDCEPSDLFEIAEGKPASAPKRASKTSRR